PERVPNSLPPLDFAKLAKLDFEAPRVDDFPALNLAREAGTRGGTLPAVLNAANEIAVAAFLKHQISFPAIWETVAATMQAHPLVEHPALEQILAADQWAREFAAELVKP
ncbi:MAG: 1-deoxy-D-xylulose-5-phosphate reductoisomerase, partial [Chthoniobacteraceae bacterium]